ncbi:MAG TPA: cytochrome c oxidase subunit II [Anaerolineales bacterium]|nr:cytochrome c oxidase subunit II [Anaerolineales bacterium]HLO30715.1 cytochrome c oxidase subunit II [Anaerolineales bacterium]
MRHFVIVGILIIVTAVLAYVGLNASGLMPVEASAQSIPIDWLWNIELITISFLFALIIVPMAYSLIAFRRKKGDTTDAEHMEGNTKLEITWTILPLVLVMVFAYMGAANLAETRRVDPEAMPVKVSARQWSWTFEYPPDPASGVAVSSDELHLPIGKQVLLQMTSSDVIHSFWVPEFRVKQDVVPGRITQLRITPILLGNYKVRCAELCGTSHAYMEKPVFVTSQADFDAWMADQLEKAKQLAATPEGAGQLLVAASGCNACHSINGAAGIGPTWFGLFGSQVPISGDGVVTANEAYIHESIKTPQAKIVAGFETQLMPTYGFTDEQIDNIVAYIKTLK